MCCLFFAHPCRFPHTFYFFTIFLYTLFFAVSYFWFLLRYSNGLRILSLAVEEAARRAVCWLQFSLCLFHFLFDSFFRVYTCMCIKCVCVYLWTLFVRQRNHNRSFNPIMQAIRGKGRISTEIFIKKKNIKNIARLHCIMSRRLFCWLTWRQQRSVDKLFGGFWH